MLKHKKTAKEKEKKNMKKLKQEEQEKLVQLVNYQANGEINDEEFIVEVSKISDIGKFFKTKNKILKIDLNLLSDVIFSEKLSVNSQKANEEMKRNSRPIGTAPLGYKNIRGEYGKSNIITVEPIVENIKKIFKNFSTGKFSLEILLYATKAWGLVGKRTKKPLQIQDIKRILKNPYYYGYAVYKGERYKHKYEAIITKKLFDKCQKVGKKLYGNAW